MENKIENRPIAIQLSGVKKMYKLGQIGGGTLTADLQSWWARVRGKEDPNTQIGTDQRLIGKTFMALNGIDLTVYKGEALGIIGTNGAGKSTLLKLLSRVTAPTEGEIDINGRITSMLEVGTGFHGEMTGRENVYLNGAILGMTKAEIDAKMDQIIEFSEVGDFIDTPVKRYSSGMYVKLAFSVAAHLDSEIMIMDEVLAVGDMKFQKKCLGRMGDAAGTEGRTVLYVSHNMNTIRQLCTRCVVLDQGKVIFAGDVEEAIGIYMQNEVKDLSSDIDLSNRKHLGRKTNIRLERFVFTNPTGPQIKLREKITFKLTINADAIVEDMRLRGMMYFADGTPIGMATTKAGALKIVPGQQTVCGEINTEHLAPGAYSVRLALYCTNEYGGEQQYDVVDHAAHFVIEDNRVVNNMAWNHPKWGHVALDDIMLVSEQSV